jgi:hypothetical protein
VISRIDGTTARTTKTAQAIRSSVGTSASEALLMHELLRAGGHGDAHFYLPHATFEDAIRACIQMGAPLTADPAEATRHLAALPSSTASARSA